MLLGILGLMGSLFIRPRRLWLRVSRAEDDDGEPGAGRTVVELAGLDRSSGGDLAAEVDELRAARADTTGPTRREPSVSTAQFAALSDNAVMFASIVYVLAFFAHLTEWVLVRSLPAPESRRRAVGRRVVRRWRRYGPRTT